MTRLLSACGRERSVRVRCDELRASLNVAQDVLEEDLNLLNLINFGGGCYALYAQVDGLDVEVTKERYGDQFARPARLSPLEAKALVWALDFIGDRLPLGAHDPLASARAKIEAAIGDGPRPTVEIGRIHTANAEVATAINQAIRDDRVVEIEYWTDSRGAMTKRAIEPHMLMNARDAWYVVSYCRRAEDRRTFRLDRIRSARVVDELFSRRPELSGTGQAPWQRDESDTSSAGTAVVWCSPTIARWFAEEHPVRATNDDGSVVVEIAFASDGWLAKEILKQQADAVLLEPTELRTTIAEIGERMLASGPKLSQAGRRTKAT